MVCNHDGLYKYDKVTVLKEDKEFGYNVNYNICLKCGELFRCPGEIENCLKEYNSKVRIENILTTELSGQLRSEIKKLLKILSNNLTKDANFYFREKLFSEAIKYSFGALMANQNNKLCLKILKDLLKEEEFKLKYETLKKNANSRIQKLL